MRENFLGYPWASILYPKIHRVWLCFFRCNEHLTSIVTNCNCRLQCIDDEVQEDLSEPRLVRSNRWNGREFGAHPRPVADLVLGHAQGRLDDTLDINSSPHVIVRTGKELQVARHIANTLRTILDITRVQPIAAENALIVRGTPDQVALAEKIVGDLDKSRAEVVVDVAILQETP